MSLVESTLGSTPLMLRVDAQEIPKPTPTHHRSGDRQDGCSGRSSDTVRADRPKVRTAVSQESPLKARPSKSVPPTARKPLPSSPTNVHQKPFVQEGLIDMSRSTPAAEIKRQMNELAHLHPELPSGTPIKKAASNSKHDGDSTSKKRALASGSASKRPQANTPISTHKGTKRQETSGITSGDHSKRQRRQNKQPEVNFHEVKYSKQDHSNHNHNHLKRKHENHEENLKGAREHRKGEQHDSAKRKKARQSLV